MAASTSPRSQLSPVATATVELPPKLVPVFTGEARVRGSYGGRGSGKTRSFAKMTAVRAYAWAKEGREGTILCGRQFMNSLDESSLEEVKAAIRSEDWLNDYFDIGEKYIRTACGRVSYKFTGLDRNIDSIKSKSRILLCWVDEAEPVSETAWQKLVPTIREEGSELWVTWNPERKTSSTHKRYRETSAADVKIVELNWRDNPWFPAVLERERLTDKRERPESYDHVWEGDFVRAVEGAYYAAALTKAREEKRIGHVAEDDTLTIRLYCDIGGTGAKADNFVFWAAQQVGTELRFVNHYEVQGQPASAHINWLLEQGYKPGRAKIWLPHDGDKQDSTIDASYRTTFEDAGFDVVVVPNQGAGAAKRRVEAARKLFSRFRFDETRCEAGLDALGWYHEKRNDEREIGLGPEHDWSSHSADAFGMAAVVYDEPTPARQITYSNKGIV